MGLGSILLHSLMLAASPVHPSCNLIPGAEQLTENPQLRWIVVGEMHGNNETPAAFADLVCLTSSWAPVVVAVEQSASEQSAIDAFINSDGKAEARAAFLRSAIWQGKMKDGRSSEAYFRLFERLRQLREAGRVTAVVAFVPSEFPNGIPSPADYEEEMARVLIGKSPPGTVVLALVGGLHARRTKLTFSDASYMPMASYLPADRTITLNVPLEGGSTWACFELAECGPNQLSAQPIRHERGVVLGPEADGAYSGTLYLGAQATASPPQQAPHRDE
jgi:hypothetical protein